MAEHSKTKKLKTDLKTVLKENIQISLNVESKICLLSQNALIKNGNGYIFDK